MRSNFFSASRSRVTLSIKNGFTLVETIVGIVVLSIAFSVLTTLIYPVVEHSADQLHQIRAAELGQSMLNEIQGRSFDENSDRSGGVVRCGESGVTCSSVMGNEEGGDRALFDDVDDYNNFTFSGENIENSLGTKLGDLYLGYTVNVSVCNDGNYDGACSSGSSDISTAKLITVTITTPTGFDIVFSTYRANF